MVSSRHGSSGRILDAALALITRRGNADVTMIQIARAARISRQAVYLHFADRTTLLVALARRLDESIGLPEAIQAVREASTGTEMVEALVALQAAKNPALWAVARAVDAVRRTDAAAERAWRDRLDHRLEGARGIVSRLQAEGRLRPGLDPAAAADLLWTMTSLRLWEDLVLERGWSPGQYQEHMTRFLLEILTGDPRAPR
jgi:AcrR family transcriptional regulator